MRVPRKKIAALIAFVGAQEGVAISEIDLAVVEASHIASLNRRYLRHTGATDVLSFDLSDADRKGICAQLIVCGDVAVEQAKAHGQGVQRELMLYVVHGLLHLMGYEDHTVRGAARMHGREDEILDAFAKRSR